ncbi:MAG: hypothetical protein P9M14_05535 [Candidatus Alcyoniella australis]|nr:hypothetical protein [Candidatus Alcyoniella australis]
MQLSRLFLITVMALSLLSFTAVAQQAEQAAPEAAAFDPADMANPIYFENNGTIYRIYIDGSNLQQVVVGTMPAVSPDNNELAFFADGDLQLLDFTQSSVELIVTSEPASRIWWTSDGHMLIYREKREDANQFVQVNPAAKSKNPIDPSMVYSRIVRPLPITGRSPYTRFNSDTGNSLRVLSGARGHSKCLARSSDIVERGDCSFEEFKGFDAYFTPDERGVIFRTRCGADAEPVGPLYFVSRNGTDLQRLTKLTYNEIPFSVSPSGRWILFHDIEPESGLYKIYRWDVQNPQNNPLELTQGSNVSW